MIKLKPMTAAPKGRVPEIRHSVRLLEGAHRTVSGLCDAVEHIDVQRRSLNTDARGRMAEEAVDVLRSAVVLTSSGLDASMKRLVRDVGTRLIPIPGTGAEAQYRKFIEDHLCGVNTPEGLRKAVLSPEPARELLNYYLEERTKSSMQGSRDLRVRVRDLLGISSKRLPNETIAKLDDFFTARNQIVHDLDYTNPRGRSVARNHRNVGTTVALCDQVFEVACLAIAGAAEALRRR